MTPDEWRALPREEKDRYRRLKHERKRKEREQRRVAESKPDPRPTLGVSETPFTDIYGNPLDLRDLYRGAHAFLLLSGPSVNNLDLSMLDLRGVITMGVNNSPAVHPVNLWTYVDRPNKFHNSIWLDPGVIKSVPIQHIKKKRWPLRCKKEDGTFENIKIDGEFVYPGDCPGVIGHRRTPNMKFDSWLHEPVIGWGNSKKSARRNKLPRILDVMFCAIKHLYAFGFRVVYLLGADFTMDYQQPYAFSQLKTTGAVNSNNNGWEKKNWFFEQLQPYFLKAGFHVFNCNPNSNLTAFPYISFEDAIQHAIAAVPQSPLDASNWYDMD